MDGKRRAEGGESESESWDLEGDGLALLLFELGDGVGTDGKGWQLQEKGNRRNVEAKL